MRVARWMADGQVYDGIVSNDSVEFRGKPLALSALHLLPPVLPRQIFGIALNFKDHAAELGLAEPPAPALFSKPLGTAIGAGQDIWYPDGASHCHYETEVAAIIGRTCSRVSAAEALSYVKGYTVANDFTCRDFITNIFRPPLKAKGFDTFCPLGPYLVTPDEIGDPSNLTIRTWVNQELRQEGSTGDFLLSIPELIAYISQFTTLEENDVILTGTPKGISPVVVGDVISCEVLGLGRLTNTVRPWPEV